MKKSECAMPGTFLPHLNNAHPLSYNSHGWPDPLGHKELHALLIEHRNSTECE